MNALAVAQRYFDAWIHRDADGIIAVFTEDGTYSDPTAGQVSAGKLPPTTREGSGMPSPI